MEYADYLERLSTTEPALARDLAPVTSLEKLLAWLPTAGVAFNQLDLVAQDEYCHDFLVPLPDGRTLAFGMT